MENRVGFTLVELVVVILLLGILAGVAVGRFQDVSEDGRKAALRSSLRAIQDQIEVRTVNNGGRFPNNIHAWWFQDKQLPEHPYNPGVPEVQRVNNLLEHPAVVMLENVSPGAYWYNAQNGIVRARVPRQKTGAETLALYNEVNNTDVTTPADVGITL